MGEGDPQTYGAQVDFFVNGHRSLKLSFKPACKILIDVLNEKFHRGKGCGDLGGLQGSDQK